MVVLDTDFQPVSPQSQVKYTFCHMMKRYGILLRDWQLHQSLPWDLITLNQKHKTGQKKNTMLYNGVRKVNFNLVLIT